MTTPGMRSELRQAFIAIAGTGVAFAFLEAGAFRALGPGTIPLMVSPAGLRAAALGAGVTGLLLGPLVAWRVWRRRR